MAHERPAPGGGFRARRRGQGELEAQVLAVLRQAPGPATAGWVQEHLDGVLAYTTVVTILSRLHAKNAVSRTRSGRSYLWLAAADAAGLAALRMRRLLDGERDRDAVLASFVTALLPHDELLLRALLDAVPAAPTVPAAQTGPPAAGHAETGRPETGRPTAGAAAPDGREG
ncbi:BlaI/MecI/CopY family transcriptional regulator [Kitasatospora sp. NBC_01539]|uniref:BlaI/MecI/CopY family transcriptional regulator n=1 Tax=Kitasatospora sp. NBC_01539 TaxID=2903577 RepID=UPI0038600C13